MYPHERSLVEQYADKPFTIIGVNSDSDRDTPRKLANDGTVTWRSFWNGGGTGGPISRQWNVRSWPTIYLIDHLGVIRYKNKRGPALDAAIAELVEAAMADQAADEVATDDVDGPSRTSDDVLGSQHVAP